MLNFVLPEENQVEAFLPLLPGIRPRRGRGIGILLLTPLMIIKVVSHLPDRLGRRILTLNGNLRQPRSHIILHVITLQDVFILIVDFDHFVACDALVVFALDGAVHLGQLLLQPVFLFGVVGWGFGQRGRGAHFYEI